MKITLNWLKQYVDVPWSPEEISERLTMLGIEVESVKKLTGEFEGVVVAQVLTREKHPNADKLSLCRVNDGKGERQIVCGAHNFKAGDKVPLILPGHTLPAKPGEQPFTIKVAKVRGVESQGMMCSPQELGLPDQVDGLLILREDAQVGQPSQGQSVAAAANHGRRWRSVEHQTRFRARGRPVGRAGALSTLCRAGGPGRQNRPKPGLAQEHSRKSRNPQHQQRRGRDELRDARNRPTVARV